MTEKKSSNLIKGRTSYDSTSTGSIIPFFNRNVSEYPTEAGGPKFDLVPVTKQKDIMLNNARHFAQQEYDRIIEVVNVLQKQADAIKRRLEVTDAVHSAEYQFQLSMGNCYWLVWNKRKEKMLLVILGPNEWSTGVPDDYEYITKVKFLGDHTWEEINE
jgi:hypothetical protein